MIFILSRLITEQANPLTISSYAKGQWVNCTQIVPIRHGGNIRWFGPDVSSGNHHDYNDGEDEAAQDEEEPEEPLGIVTEVTVIILLVAFLNPSFVLLQTWH